MSFQAVLGRSHSHRRLCHKKSEGGHYPSPCEAKHQLAQIDAKCPPPWTVHCVCDYYNLRELKQLHCLRVVTLCALLCLWWYFRVTHPLLLLLLFSWVIQLFCLRGRCYLSPAFFFSGCFVFCKLASVRACGGWPQHASSYSRQAQHSFQDWCV